MTTHPDDIDELSRTLTFLRHAERLKDTLRSGHTSEGRPESVAEHSWRLCLMALVLRDRFPAVDFARLIGLCIVHDLGEAISGDIPATEQDENVDKSIQERDDLLELLASLPTRQRAEIVDLWDEYEAATTPEARLAKALDKLETLLQHTQGDNPPDFDYRFNLRYGKQYTVGDPTVETLRRLIDADTATRAEEADRSHAPTLITKETGKA